MFNKKIHKQIKKEKKLLHPFYAPKTGKKFLISDLHFEHVNIIERCRLDLFRKGDILTMNEVLIHNWNNIVSNHDTVFFLGDLLDQYYEPYFPRYNYYRQILNGKIIHIKGNHDEKFKKKLPRFKPLRYQNINFLLIHDLDKTFHEIKEEYDFSKFRYDWIIHGHYHNNNLKKYPFINGKLKTINVSAELLNYQPIDFDHLLSLDINSIKRMDTISSPVIRR